MGGGDVVRRLIGGDHYEQVEEGDLDHGLAGHGLGAWYVVE